MLSNFNPATHGHSSHPISQHSNLNAKGHPNLGNNNSDLNNFGENNFSNLSNLQNSYSENKNNNLQAHNNQWDRDNNSIRNSHQENKNIGNYLPLNQGDRFYPVSVENPNNAYYNIINSNPYASGGNNLNQDYPLSHGQSHYSQNNSYANKGWTPSAERLKMAANNILK